MKKFKLLFLSIVISLGIFSSCTNNDNDDNPIVQRSETVQNVIAELRTMFNEDGSVITDQQPTGNLIFDFCFEFVYPIELVYNTGTIVTINSNEELITVIMNSTNELYIVGIEFPFDVQIYNPNTNEVEILTITNEEQFITLLASCSFNDPCDCEGEIEPVCVDIEVNGEVITLTFPNECYAECEGFTENDIYECEVTDCDCPTDYDPVCVEVNGEIIQFDNYCLAECIGYTQQDMVDCENSGDDCEIEELDVTVGECNADGTYSITINFDFTGDQANFDLYVRNDVLIGNYPVASLPITIENFQLSGFEEDYIKVCFEGTTGSGGEDCCKDKEWEAPDCNGNGGDCIISDLEVEVGECNPIGTYSLTINFDYDNTNGQEYFDLFVRNDEFIGYFLLSDLPLTLPNFELSGYDDDYIKVCINDIEDCCQEIEWEAPDCDNTGDDCYEFVFPISLFLNGVVETANSNEDVDDLLALGYHLSYPIDIIINNEVITVQQGILEGAYGERCD